MSCSGCEKEYPIINKKYNLCESCNYQRLHGRSKAEVYSERAASRPPKVYQLKTYSKPLRQQTSKESKIKKELSAIKYSIELDAIQDDKYYCWGCGCTGSLDKSHILSVGQFKRLELDKNNINLFCRGCHDIWESGEISEIIELKTLEKDLEYMKLHSQEYFSKISRKIIEYYEISPAKINQNILKIII